MLMLHISSPMNGAVCVYVGMYACTVSFLIQNYIFFAVALPVSVKKCDSVLSNMQTAEQASFEFGVLLGEILKELMENERENLKLLKRTSSTYIDYERHFRC